MLQDFRYSEVVLRVDNIIGVEIVKDCGFIEDTKQNIVVVQDRYVRKFLLTHNINSLTHVASGVHNEEMTALYAN